MKIITLLLILYTLCPISGYAKMGKELSIICSDSNIDKRAYAISLKLKREVYNNIINTLHHNLTSSVTNHPTWYGVQNNDSIDSTVSYLLKKYLIDRYDFDLYKSIAFNLRNDKQDYTDFIKNKELKKNIMQSVIFDAILWEEIDAIVLCNRGVPAYKEYIKSSYEKRVQEQKEFEKYKAYKMLVNRKAEVEEAKITSFGQEVSINEKGRFVHRISTPAFAKENGDCIIKFLKKNIGEYFKERRYTVQSIYISQDSTFITSYYPIEYYHNTAQSTYQGEFVLTVSFTCDDAYVMLYNPEIGYHDKSG